MQFAILGSHPNISLSEIKSITGQTPIDRLDQVAVFDDLGVELTTLQDRLAGVQKLGHIIGSVKRDQLSDLPTLAVSILLDNPADKKIVFGISVYNLTDTKSVDTFRAKAQKLGLQIKKELKQAGQSARFVTSKEPTLSSVVIVKNHLLQNGAEFVLLIKKDEILIGQTAAVQDFESWSHRDFDRPARDPKRGMLPPKLARLMVNLSGVNPEKSTLLDPFCGSGTILMEAGLLGFQNLIGSDIAPEAIDDTTENLNWLKDQNYQMPETQLLVADASELSNQLEPESIDVIVTEPFLGKPRQGRESEADIEKMIDGLAGLYHKTFSNLKTLMKPGAVLIIASPVHYFGEKSLSVPTEKIINDLGFQSEPLADEPLIYRHEDQFVGRQLLKFSIK